MGTLTPEQLAAVLVTVSQFMTSVKAGAVVAWLMQEAKLSKWKIFNWIGAHTPWVNRIVSIVAAAGTATGIHHVWNVSAGTLLFTGITWAAIRLGLWHTLISYLVQHGWYKAVFAKSGGVFSGAPPEIKDAPEPMFGSNVGVGMQAKKDS